MTTTYTPTPVTQEQQSEHDQRMRELNERQEIRAIVKKIRTTWYNMMHRCSNDNIPAYQNVNVCDEWKNLVTFCEWCLSNESNFDMSLREKQSLSRTSDLGDYRPGNVTFTKTSDNHTASFWIVNNVVTGEEFLIRNLKQFADDRDLPVQMLYRAARKRDFMSKDGVWKITQLKTVKH